MQRLLQQKIVTGFIIGLVLIVILSGLSFYSIKTMNDDSRMVAHTHEVLENIAIANATFTNGNRAHRGFLLTGDSAFLKPYILFKQSKNEKLQRLRQLVADNARQRIFLDSLQQYFEAGESRFEENIQLSDSIRINHAFAVKRLRLTEGIMVSAQFVIDSLAKNEERLLTQRNRQSNESAMWTLILLAGTAATGLALGLFAIISIQKDFRQQSHILDQLQESEERFRLFMENSPMMAFIKDRQGRLLFINSVLEKAFLKSRDEILGKDTRDLIPAEEHAMIVENDEKIFRSGVVQELIEPVTMGDGKRYHWLSVKFPFKNNAGEDFLGGVSIDITSRIRAQESLLESEERFRAIFENSGVGIVLATPKGHLLEGNPAFGKLTGYTTEELKGMHISVISLPDELATEEVLYKQLLKAEIPSYQLEKRFVQKSGSMIWVKISISAVRDETGNPEYIVGIVENITQQKQSLERLEQRDKMLQGASSALNTLLGTEEFDLRAIHMIGHIGNASGADRISVMEDIMDGDGNPCFKILYSWGADLPVASGILNGEAVPFKNFDIERWYAELAKGNIINADVAELPEKEQVYLQRYGYKTVLLIPIFFHEKLWGHFGISTSTRTAIWTETELALLKSLVVSFGKAMEREEAQESLQKFNESLIEARKEAERANAAKSAFLSSMSHELRTPLNAIMGFAQILRKDDTIPETQRGYVETMYKSGDHLLEMINDILDISKIESEKLELMPEDFILPEMLNDMYNMFYLHCEEKGLEFSVNYPADLPGMAYADVKRLRQVLINLLSNAVKFTSRGSVALNVSLKEGEPDGGHIRTFRYEVTDTGRGIPPDQITAIFEPFRQLSGMYSEGTGLGLAISSRIVTMMGGKIEVDSQIEKGSRFFFEIPMVIPANTFKNREEDLLLVTGIKNSPEVKVLIVDDVENNRTVVRTLLDKVGFTCAEAADGHSALVIARQFRPHIILMDILMPNMSGYQSLAALRSEPFGMGLPVIALTASGLMTSREELLAVGFSEYIAKPFREMELLEAIARLTNIQYTFIKSDEENRQNKDFSTRGSLVLAARHIARLPEHVRNPLIEAIEVQEFDTVQRILTMLEGQQNDGIAEMSVLLKAAKTAHFKAFHDVAEILREEKNV